MREDEARVQTSKMDKADAFRLLRRVPLDKAFFFFEDIGKFTGKVADSLKEFVDMVEDVVFSSIDFHLNRGDFELWIRDVIGDEWLAGRLAKLKEAKLSGEELFARISELLKTRYRQLMEAAEVGTKPLEFYEPPIE